MIETQLEQKVSDQHSAQRGTSFLLAHVGPSSGLVLHSPSQGTSKKTYMNVDEAACWTVLRLPVYHRALKQARVNCICLTCSSSLPSCCQKTFKYRATSSPPYQILLKECYLHQHSLTPSGCAVCSACEAGSSHSLASFFIFPDWPFYALNLTEGAARHGTSNACNSLSDQNLKLPSWLGSHV